MNAFDIPRVRQGRGFDPLGSKWLLVTFVEMLFALFTEEVLSSPFLKCFPPAIAEPINGHKMTLGVVIQAVVEKFRHDVRIS